MANETEARLISSKTRRGLQIPSKRILRDLPHALIDIYWSSFSNFELEMMGFRGFVPNENPIFIFNTLVKGDIQNTF